MMDLNYLAEDCYEQSAERGWWDDDPFPNTTDSVNHYILAAKLMLVVSELSEALEDLRNYKHPWQFSQLQADQNGKPQGFAVEMADALIRLLDLTHACGIDMEQAVRMKMMYNASRPFKHGGKAI